MSCDCVAFRGKRMDKRTARMIVMCEKDYKLSLTLTQGCCNKGGVAASAGTHDCEGVVDFAVGGLSQGQINTRVKALRKVGFAAWHRTTIPGLWGAHIHAVAVGCKDLPQSASNQVVALRHGLDGLADHKPDPHRGMHLPVITFEKYKAIKAAKALAAAPLLNISATIAAARKGDYSGTLGKLMALEGVPATQAGYAKIQRDMNYRDAAADGIPGPESLGKLVAEHHYRIAA